MVFFRRTRSWAPKYWKSMMLAPMVMPMAREIMKNRIGKLAPIAASASLPNPRPTITLSTVMYSCWNTLPMSIGIANRMMTPASPP